MTPAVQAGGLEALSLPLSFLSFSLLGPLARLQPVILGQLQACLQLFLSLD